MWLLFQVQDLFKPSSATRERLFCNVMLVWRGPFNLSRVQPPSAWKLGLHVRKNLSQIPYGIFRHPLQPQHFCEKLPHWIGFDHHPLLAYGVSKGLGHCAFIKVCYHTRLLMERIPFWKGHPSLGIQEGESHMLGEKRVARLKKDNERIIQVGREL